MPYPLPPNKAGMLTATKIQDQGQRIGVEERRILPEPRSYYVKSAANIQTSGTARSTVLTVPIFWRPGNMVRVLFKCDYTSNGAMSADFIMDGGPFGNSAAVPIISAFTPVVFANFGTVVTQSNGTAKLMTVAAPFAAQWQEWVPFVGQTGNATSAGQRNLAFKVARTAGAADFISISAEAWVMVL